MTDKRTLIAAIRARIAEELATMKRLAMDAAEAASHEENKPENDKDMRSTEASYVARGQAGRARELERELAVLGAMEPREFASTDAIEASALIELHQDGGGKSLCLLLPAGGGQRVRVEGQEVQVVTLTSPLGSALLGASEGDDVEVRTPQGTKVYEIVQVR